LSLILTLDNVSVFGVKGYWKVVYVLYKFSHSIIMW